MKHWKLVLGIVILVIVFILIIIFLMAQRQPNTTSPSTISTSTPFTDTIQPAANTAESPATFTSDFYSWYLRNAIANVRFPSSSQDMQAMQQWITPDFAANWQTIVDNTDGDPVLLAQDFDNSWATDIATTIVSETNTTSTVNVTLGKSPSDSDSLVVNLIKVNGQWRISQVSAP